MNEQLEIITGNFSTTKSDILDKYSIWNSLFIFYNQESRAGRTEEFPGILMVCPEDLDPNFWSQDNNSSSNNNKNNSNHHSFTGHLL